MGQIREASELVERLYDQGSTNNEDLQQLLMYLKEISDSTPENLRHDFLEIFIDIDISESVLNSTNTMLMMLLTRLAFTYRSTETSQDFIRSKQMEEALAIKLREAELSLRDYFQSRFT